MSLVFLLLVVCEAPERPDDPVDTGADTGGPPASGGDLFATERVHNVDLEVAPADIDRLNAAPKTYVEAAATFDGVRFERVGLRVKGSSTLQTFDGKPSLKIDLNRYVDQDLDGIELVQLHGMVIDGTQLHEAMAWHVAAELGLPHSRVSYVRLTVNGEDYGLYAHVEAHDDVWMDRTFGDQGAGRLYEGGYPHWPESYAHADFLDGEVQNFDLEEGEDVAWADLLAATTQIADRASPGWYDRVDPLLELDAFTRFVAAEAWIGQWDGYAYVSNNFRVYVDGNGRSELVMSGLDWTFTEGADWGNPSAPLVLACRADADCAARLDAAVAETCEGLDADALLAERDRLWALIEADVLTDPRRPMRIEQVREEQTWLDQWLRDRSEMLAAQWVGGMRDDLRWD
ncbi:MAG: CotH kinase family protein [Myxococcota bacterium]